MAKVLLRNYTREIERLIEQGQMDEAIAHCLHILNTFPKHLETYRLLGKAFLESRRYSEAVDVFGRVLMAAPDDFVAHVGLSIIRDEENKLDDSIWHMERAFEAQPSNSAIQGELQRLYGRHDGMEPPKIRMTRGALAHMYVQGELYPQAIAEIRAVLAQDPQRSDMQILLATSYFKSGQKSNALEICNQLLKSYPYCFDANRIMVDLFSATAEADERTQVHRMRVGELDPYAVFAKGSVFQINEVPDASVNLERLEYTGGDIPAGQEWSSALGIGFDASAVPAPGASSFDNQPDWLKFGGFTDDETPPSTGKLQSAPAPGLSPQGYSSSETDDDDIPDFLRTTDWAESNTPESSTPIIEQKTTEDLAPADLPDWLKRQVPVSDDQASATSPDLDASESADTPDWLSGLGGAQAPQSFETPQIQSSDDVPDWLRGLSEAEASSESAQPTDLSADSLLNEAENVQASAQPADAPDWLNAIESNHEPAPAGEIQGATSDEQADEMDWLKSLAATPGDESEDIIIGSNEDNEKSTEWAAQAQNGGQQIPPQQPNVRDLGASPDEQDDTTAWLESLTTKDLAGPEGVDQAQSNEEPSKPEWVVGADNNIEQSLGEFENTSTGGPAADETGLWLRDLDKNEKQEEQTEAQNLPHEDFPEWFSEARQAIQSGDQLENFEEQFAEQDPDSPDWLNGLEEETPVQETSFTGQKLNDQDLSNWLSGLDDEPGLDFDPEFIRSSARPPFSGEPGRPGETQEPSKSDSVTSDWLSALDDEEEAVDETWKNSSASTLTEETPVTHTTDTPNWLQGVEEEIGEAELASEDDKAPWLHRELWEEEGTPQEPKPTSPTDWHPLEDKPVEESKPDLASGTPTSITAPPAKKKPEASTRQPKAEGQGNVNVLNQAKGELDRGDIPTALNHYGKLIKKGKHLEETIRDLRESIYRYPVEVSIWQTLGDAYMRANRLKEALEAFNKAEELIR